MYQDDYQGSIKKVGHCSNEQQQYKEVHEQEQ